MVFRLHSESTLNFIHRTVYFIVLGSPLQFTICAFFQLSIDIAIIVQWFVYGTAPPMSVLLSEEDELEQALALGDE